jgi:hypothetical protein
MKWLDTPSKILAFALAIAVFTWTSIQIGDWYERPSEELTAEVSISPFTLPPTVESAMLSSTNADQQIQSALFWLKTYDSQWVVTIHNSGQKTLNEVILRLPSSALEELSSSALVEIYFGDKRSQVFNSSQTVNIGTLTPGESVKVICWDATEFPQEHFPTLESEISLVHSSGIGKIKRMVTVQDSKLIFIAEHPFIIVLFLLLIFMDRVFMDRISGLCKFRSDRTK